MLRLRAIPVPAMVGVLLALAAVPAQALDPHTALAHYGYQSWQTDSGLPQNTVHAIVQGRDGFLWIATEGGLVRFDGAEFAVFNHANTPALPSDLVDGLTEDPTGALWISTSGGLAVLRDGRIEAFGPKHGVPATQIWRTWCDRVSDTREGERGTVWVLTAAGLFRIDPGSSRAEAVPPGQNDLTENSAMAMGPHGTLWLGTEQGLMRAAAGPFLPVGAAGEVLALAVDGNGTAWAGLRSGLEACSAAGCRSVAVPGAVEALAADTSGHMWIGTTNGLYVAEHGSVRAIEGATGAVSFLFCDREGMIWAGTARGLMRIALNGTSAVLPREGDVYLAAAEDREGDLWLGTASSGLAVLRNRKFFTLTAEEGLTQEYVLALAQAPNGHVGVGTNGGGLNVFREGKFHALTTAQGLTSNVVLALAAAPGGEVWVGTPDGLDLLRDGQMTRAFTTADGLADDFIRSLHFGPHGALWIGTSHGLSRHASGAFTTWTTLDGLGSDLIGAMANDRGGNLWIGTLGGLTQYRDGQFRNFTTKDGLSSDVITSLYADRTGTLWIGTNDAGLDRMAGGRIVALQSDELPRRVLGILEDSRGYLWLSSNSGVYRVSRAGLNAMAAGGAAPEVMRFGVTDGMRISECSSGGHPAALRLRDGELWFATLKGIAVVDPEQMPLNRIPPPVVIERVSVDDVPQASATELRVAPGHSHYEFDYAGLSFVAPQKVEYRYQLVGFDRGWVDAGTRRAAYYTNLPQGHYVFRVMARNNDGVWSAAPAKAALVVEPHFYQLLWFQLLVALALLALGYAAWRRRLLRVEREFQAVLAERTRIAREIHDTLAQGFVAVSVQLELIARAMQTSVESAREQLARTQEVVRSSLEEARTSIWELRSQTVAREGLAVRLLKMAEDVAASSHARARVQMQVSGAYHRLDAAVEREALRIAREAVVNAVRHGDPENLWLRLEFAGSIFGLEIRDDGRGFAGTPPDGSSGHFGLTGMRERAASIGGTLMVESRPGEGTRVRMMVPLTGATTQARETEKTETEKARQS
ncbi:MAG TPA: two-component regulator propeller domain-containing protein [Acidobacteriaceae bacterium]|nr:two-component regulator propeller domain-containing protein [Acidobacteriaceae bacterium]